MVKEEKFFVGDFIVLPAHNKIVHGEQSFQLEPKIMDVLCYLITHKNQVISKQTLLDALWPGQMLGQDVITRAIFELRKTFGDDAKQPIFISTIPRKGYCFIHDVTSDDPIPIRVNSNVVSTKTQYIVSLFVVIALLIAYWLWLGVSEPKISKPQLSLVSHQFDKANNPNISPNGVNLLYVAEQNDEYFVVKTDIGSEKQTVLIRTAERIVAPKWLNNNEIIYGKCEDGKCGLHQFNIAERANSHLPYQTREIFSIEVAPKNQQVLIANLQGGFRSFDIVDLANHRLLELPEAINARRPVWGNNDRQVFFLANTPNGNQTFNSFDVTSFKQTEIELAVDQIFTLATMNNDKILISARKDGLTGVWTYATNSAQFAKLIDATPGEVISDLAFHNESQRLIFKNVKRNIDINIEGLDVHLPNVNSELIDLNAVYLTKREQLLFVSNRSGAYELWSAQQEELKRLTNLKLNVIDRPIVNIQQNQLAFVSTKQNISKLSVINLDTQQITFTHQFDKKVFLLGWANDETGLYFSTGTRENYAIYNFSLLDKATKPVMVNAGVMFHEDKQGNHYFVNMARNFLMQQQPNGEVSALFQLPESMLLTPHQTAIVDQELYFVERFNNRLEVKVVSLIDEQHKEHSVMKLPRNAYITQLGGQKNPFVIYDLLIEDKHQLVIAQFDKAIR
ncbi:hypothetical protein HII17_09060 [Thalassotalea sp. M1531]|uniref:OmpR/PhoB-type domain-containing protein n=1 Tax=Thalassotalea algicola TaxID=2716224 RepID=A0A7Y0LBV9_9GAMM|nr:winged helix-turn-helix domain-containing protein [Thalassotalea algicola]NMP31710.1 hypothetical protein [Thalassotalea algicola]